MRMRLAHLGLAALLEHQTYGSHIFDPHQPVLDVDSSLRRQRLVQDPQFAVAQRAAEESLRRANQSRAKTRVASDFFIGERDVLDARTSPCGERHPFWHFEGSKLARFRVYVCCVFLFLAGVLCSAAGIGGGGIYVTVLMVAGDMRVTDAVPLSKAVVFFGSISSLILNMRRGGGPSQPLIDYNICRMVVPSALLGTFLGVFLNRHLPSWIILIVLVSVLVFISWSVTNKTWQQYKEEEQSAMVAVKAKEALPPPTSTQTNEASSPGADEDPVVLRDPAPCEHSEERGTLSGMDVGLSVTMLVLVIIFGMLRFHAGECQKAEPAMKEEACNHPAHFWLGHGTMEKWLSTPYGATFVRGFSFFFPLCVCAAVLAYYKGRLVTREKWQLSETFQYSVMAILTGCLAGLVGIGGGLIFAPFFLIMGVEPSVAVASSATCVIFTSSSTCMQYLLTDRIIISLTVIYGTINLLASYVGTSLVHMLQDKFSARKSYISFIVLVGVLISTVLSIIKLITKLTHPTEACPSHD